MDFQFRFPLDNPSFSKRLPLQQIFNFGKTRGTVELPKGCSQEEALAAAQALSTVAKQMEGKELKKVIFVADKILNLVVK